MEAATMEAPTKTNAQIVAKRFREMAKWLEQHPDLPVPHWEGPEILTFATSHIVDGETSKEVMARAAKAMGKGKKQYDDDYFKLIAETPEGCSFKIYASRKETCTAKVVGTKKVTVPAVEAKPAIPETEIEVDVIEWDCEGILEPDRQGNR